MARFRIARLLGVVLTISVMTGTAALPVMAAEEIVTAAELPGTAETAKRLPKKRGPIRIRRHLKKRQNRPRMPWQRKAK